MPIAKKSPLVIEATPPRIFQCGVEPIEALINEVVDDQQGVPFGNWLQFTGMPGTGKTRLALQLVNGLGHNPEVEVWHFDWEMGKHKIQQVYRQLSITHVHRYEFEYKGNALQEAFKKAKELLPLNRALVILLDSWEFLLEDATSMPEQRELAKLLKSKREEHPNLLIITINHLTKQGKIQGPAQVLSFCDINLKMVKKGDCVYLGAPKNRFPVEDAPEHVKLRHMPRVGWTIDRTPDWVTDLPFVSTIRDWYAKRTAAAEAAKTKTKKSESTALVPSPGTGIDKKL